MKTGSLRARVVLVTVGVLALVLVAVITSVTLSYRSSLTHDLESRLAAASAAVAHSGSASTAKGLSNGLALDGIATEIKGPPPIPPKAGGGGAAPTKPGPAVSSSGGVLIATDVLPDGSQVIFTASQASIDRTIAKLLALEVGIALVALLLGVFLMLRATKVALRPLAEVVDTASSIAAGDTSLRLRPSRTDTELGTMAATFDQMVDALESAVTEATEAEESMRVFLADASHELRTPVAALQASAESLLRDQPDRPARDQLEAALAGAATRLGRLVDNLLSLARLDQSDRGQYRAFDLAEIASEVVEMSNQHSSRAHVTLATQSVLVWGDPAELARVIQNLLDNALSASPVDGVVRVGIVTKGSYAEVRVADTGFGVSASERERIFDRFVRLENAQSPGTGLGLPIARKIARQHGGDLICEEVPTGATFLLRIPRLAPSSGPC